MEQRILGDYTIIKSIGQGALGAVYLAEHRFMKKQFSLKILPAELASDRGFIQRFEEEIAQLASLDHPNIVKIYNVSSSQGVYFIVADCIVDEFGETMNLARYLMTLNRELGEDEIFSFLKKISSALDYAHRKKNGVQAFFHRNLKLNNILIGCKRQRIELYVSDFGLSSIIGPGAVLTRTYQTVADALEIECQANGQNHYYPNPSIENQKLTSLHTSFLQNYAFLAPEQKRLDPSYPVGYKADIYAFGILAYFLLMQEFPEGIFEMPSARRNRQYNWDLLLTACLQRNPNKRTDELESVLNQIAQDKPEIVSLEKNLVESAPHFNPTANVRQESLAAKYSLEESKKEEKEVEKSVQVLTISTEAIQENHLKPVFHDSQLERPQTDLDPAAIFQVDSAVKLYNPEPRDITNIKPLLTDMVVIRGGSFYRGSQDGNRDEMPRHQICLSSFAIDIHPITNEQFVRFLEVMGGEKDSNHNDIIRLRDSRIKRSGGKTSIESGYAKHPVVGVTWYGAVAYAKWIGKRLPTEAEWEIASRGGRESALYPVGNEIEKFQANFFSSDTTTVMSYAPNDYGLYDMAGNVYEWCCDWYGYNYYEVSVQEPENPKGPLQGVYRVLRGGCWKSLKEDLRCSRRHRNNPGTVNGTYGFRCATNVENS